MTLHRPQFAITLLLVMSALFVISASSPSGPVHAAPSMSVSTPDGPRGTKVVITGTGFASADAGTCTISSTTTGLITSPVCTINSSGVITSASFIVGNSAAPGGTTVTVTGSSGDSASAPFTVDAAPALTLAPPSGGVGQIVTLSLSAGQFSSGDSSCTITSSPTSPVLITSAFCVLSAGGSSLSGSQFTVASTASGSYTVIVTGSPGLDTASAFFTVSPNPTISVSLPDGPRGTSVTVSGSGFSNQDAGLCVITATPSTLEIASPSCSISATGVVSGSFKVGGSSTAGVTDVKVTGLTGDFDTALFEVLDTPVLTLTPSSGPPGTMVAVSISGGSFSSGDLSCTMTATPTSPALFSSSACIVSGGTLVGSSFTVADAASGTYVVTVTGSPGGDFAQASFIVAPRVVLSPTSGGVGQVVSFSGSGFTGTATDCSLEDSVGGAMPNANFGDVSCDVLGSSGQVSGSFRVLAAAVVGTYVINVTDNAPSPKSGAATFTVGAPTATITLTPTTQSAGATVAVSGSGFNVADTTCTIVGAPVASPSCGVSGGNVAGTFTIAPATTGGLYLITVQASPQSDFASNYLSVIVVTVQTSTTTTTTTLPTSTTGTTTTTSSTQVSTSFSTTTQQTTGISTWIFTTYATTTQTYQTTTSVSTTLTTSSITTIYSTRTVTISTVITHTLGQIIPPSTSSSADLGYAVTFLSLLALAHPIFTRRSHG